MVDDQCLRLLGTRTSTVGRATVAGSSRACGLFWGKGYAMIRSRQCRRATPLSRKEGDVCLWFLWLRRSGWSLIPDL